VRLIRLAVVTAVVLAVSPAAARADGFFIPYLGYNFGGDSSNCATLTDCQEKHANYGVALGSMGTVFGFEEDIAYAKNFFGQTPGADTAVLTVMSNLLVGVGAGPVQPYLVGGLGLIRPRVSLNVSSVTAAKNAVGFDLGGGIAGYFSPHVGLRGDLRRFHTFQDINLPVNPFGFTGEKLDFWRASLGLALRF
jgi:hypothetical protein